MPSTDYVRRYATEEALKEHKKLTKIGTAAAAAQESDDSSSSESSLSDFSEDEAQDMEL